MVSALASSSVGFPRNVSVKVLVRDWDLLCRGEVTEEPVKLKYTMTGAHEPGRRIVLTSAEGTVSGLRARRRRGGGRAGRPGWERWRRTGLSEVTPAPTGMERRRQSGVLLWYVHTHTHTHMH